MMKTLTTLSIAAITALFIGCGGGGGSSPAGAATSSAGASTSSSSKIQGHLVDAPVEGVFYSCGGPNSRGFTDRTGLFVCESSPIEFYIGKLSLGIVKIPTADGNVYPQDMVGAERSDFADADVVKWHNCFNLLMMILFLAMVLKSPKQLWINIQLVCSLAPKVSTSS
jgi:hypothetical protein